MNDYIFIIWNKALFCRDRILNDLQKSFEVREFLYIEWNKESFIRNIKALYGHKSTDAHEKIKYTGKGKFLLILIRDDDPVFETIQTPDGEETVNINVLKKKKLYRNWTADNFRVHASTNEKETNHDLTILFGCDYLRFLEETKDGETINKKPAVFNEFRNIEELKKTIEMIDDNYVYSEGNDRINVFCRYKTDINNILSPDDMPGDCLYTKRIGDGSYTIRLYGEKDGDLPKGFLSKINNDLLKDFERVQDTYDMYLNDRTSANSELISFFEKYSFDKDFIRKDADYRPIRKNIKERIKDIIKYCIAVIKNR